MGHAAAWAPTGPARCTRPCDASGWWPSSAPRTKGGQATCCGFSARSITGSGIAALGSATGGAEDAPHVTQTDDGAAGDRASLTRRLPGRFQSALASGAFTVTAEIGPPRGADADVIRSKVLALRGWVAAVNITDNQSAVVRLSSWAGSLLTRAAGVEPIMQLTCRDRNRIALQSELLSASVMGIPNILVMTGDHPRFGDHADAKPVFDLDSVQLLWVARTMRDERRLLNGRALDPPPSWFLGAVENPFAPPANFRAARLGKKIAA